MSKVVSEKPLQVLTELVLVNSFLRYAKLAPDKIISGPV